jgi:pimeloyl-ACP methyl ester carboxylesterase
VVGVTNGPSVLNPFYFGDSARQLFGMYDPGGGGGERGAVVCHPWGQEYLRAHPSVRRLARMLADRQVHAMRFDYYGCGDSAGDDRDGSVDQWRQDLAMAVTELRDMASLRKVSLVGLRFGAALAATCATERDDLDRLVLWDPIFDGSAYVRELTAGRAGAGPDGAVQVRGFPLTGSVRDDMCAVTPAVFRRPLPPTLVVSTVAADTYGPLQRALREGGTDVVTAFCPGPRAWSADTDFAAAGMPVGALDRIADWIAA